MGGDIKGGRQSDKEMNVADASRVGVATAIFANVYTAISSGTSWVALAYVDKGKKGGWKEERNAHLLRCLSRLGGSPARHSRLNSR